MTDEATQKGVSDSDSYINASRLDQVNAISQRRAEEREDEEPEEVRALIEEHRKDLERTLAGEEPGDAAGFGEDDDDPDEAGAGEEDGSGEEVADAAPDAAQESESPLFMKDGQWMVKMKVDGDVREIPYAKVLANAQKLEAGDLRLQEANRRLREAEEREQRLLGNEPGQQQNQPPAQGADYQGQTHEGQPDEETKSLIKQYHEALLNGDDEETTNALLEKLATANRQQPAVDVDAIAVRVKASVTESLQEQERQKERARQDDDRKAALQAAYKTFTDEFEDIVGDPQLTAMADRLTLTVASEHPTYTPEEVMREAGNRTRKWLRDKTGAVETSVRQSRKRQLKTAAGNNARTTTPPSEKPKTRTDRLNEIRAARGQRPTG